MLTCVLSGIALGLSATMIYIQATAYRTLERESRLAQLEIDNFRAVLHDAGLDPDAHKSGDKP